MAFKGWDLSMQHGGSQVHCGYDSDCQGKQKSGIKWTATAASASAQACAAAPPTNCNPVTTKTAANGLTYGLTSFRTLPSGSLFDIPEVTGSEDGDNGAYWDYSKFREGATFPGLNRDF